MVVHNLEAWVDRLFGKSQRTSPDRPLPPIVAPVPARLSAFEQKLDAAIAAAEMSIAAEALSISRAESLASLADDNNAFAIALYAQLRLRSGNHFFSPFSIRTALAMTHVGAPGETATQMRKALCVSTPDDAMHAGCADLVRSIRAASGAQYDMVVANSLWSQVGARSSLHSQT
jgi:serine protease inhibitor